MTVLIGIKANEGVPGVVLASDTNALNGLKTSYGTNAYNQVMKGSQKIFSNKNHDFAFAVAGLIDQYMVEFIHGLIEGKIDLKKSIKKKSLNLLNKLHMARCDYSKLEKYQESYIMFASRFENEPRLHFCYPLGRIKEYSFHPFGLAESHAIKAVNSSSIDRPPFISLEQAVDLAENCLEKASQNPYIDGIDIAAVTAKGIAYTEGRINKLMNKARHKGTEDFKKQDLSSII